MALYHALILEVEGRPEGSTVPQLKRIGSGKYANIIDDCIRKVLITVLRKITLGEDLYFITDKGRKYLPEKYFEKTNDLSKRGTYKSYRM